ncbi:hypothetical protein [uncultured Bradyrhizobium sp.]|jgi:hypothetical protein|uniref:hypothetical protein n=1 Tax=uncultured Bradyrhizobium sp. TaxID=199684 RepID=UPI002635715C|nr:hypothetical protein [uncultured Bradyrhizobium sp.]
MTEVLHLLVGELPQLANVAFGLLLTWFIGQRVLFKWNMRQKEREIELATARDFHALYGEFFATWKLWDSHCKDRAAGRDSELSRSDLLDRASSTEGRLESMLVRFTSGHDDLDPSKIEVLGRFRALFQLLRESIRANEPLPWSYSGHPQYVAFKTLAPQVASMIVQGSVTNPKALLEITDNKWESYTVELIQGGTSLAPKLQNVQVLKETN